MNFSFCCESPFHTVNHLKSCDFKLFFVYTVGSQTGATSLTKGGIAGRKFLPGRNWGGKAVNEKSLCFYY